MEARYKVGDGLFFLSSNAIEAGKVSAVVHRDFGKGKSEIEYDIDMPYTIYTRKETEVASSLEDLFDILVANYKATAKRIKAK